ncbi:MAG TPA: histidinol-phosphate transaminase [Deltaproteobacteria bacterium]|nr:histidinol-phosphate transaminase [Deltaproteobacteria bacterium]
MRKLVRKGVEDLVPYPPGKPIEELERELGISGSIKLASNENPLGPSPLAVQTVINKVSTLNRYPDGSGYYLKSKLNEKFNIPFDQIILGNGSNELIELIIRTFLSPGDHAIQPFPTFLVYEKVVKGAGGNMTSVPLSNLSIDLEGILNAITPKTRVIFICNPNNPTGAAISKDDMVQFLRETPGDIIVVLDEAYIEFTTDEKTANGINLLDIHPFLFVLRTFSKLYGLAGLRIGYGFAPQKVVDYMNRVRQPFNANTLAQAAATTALDDSSFVHKTLQIVREGLHYLCHNLDEIGLQYIPTQTNFFLIKVPGGGKKVYELMLKQGVIVRAMDSYDLPDYIRISVGLPEENERFIETLRRVIS